MTTQIPQELNSPPPPKSRERKKRADDNLLMRNSKSSEVAERELVAPERSYLVRRRFLLATVRRRDTQEELIVPFPAGATWPGKARVNEMGLDCLSLRAVAGATYQELRPTGRDLERGESHIDTLVMTRSYGPNRASWLLRRVGVDLRDNNNEVAGLLINGTRKNYRNRDQRFGNEDERDVIDDGRSRHRQIKGPDINAPFVVLQGAVVVEGEVPVTLTAGMAWPGVEALGPLDASLQPCHSWLADGSTTGQWLSQGDIEAGRALLFAALLSRIDNRDCVRMLGPEMQKMSLESNAGIMGASPDNLRRIMADMQRSGALGWARVEFSYSED